MDKIILILSPRKQKIRLIRAIGYAELKVRSRKEIRPNLMVTTSGGQHLNETVCVEDYVAHDIQRLL